MQIYGLLRNLFYCLKGMKMMIIFKRKFVAKKNVKGVSELSYGFRIES